MRESGISVNIFGSHSTRSTSTSKCKDIRVIIHRNYEVSRIVEGKNICTGVIYTRNISDADYSQNNTY